MVDRWLYPVGVGIAIIAYLLIPHTAYHHPDSSYLAARYAQNLINGEGFVYNPGERILLTTDPLPILAQAFFAMPAGEIQHPPELLPLLLIGLGAAALIRLLRRDEIPLAVILGAGFLWLMVSWLAFGSVQWWLSALMLIALDLAEHNHWLGAGLIAGLTLLVAPLALFFVALLGVQAQDRRYWGIAFLPVLIWYSFAVFYFGEIGLRGLTLPMDHADGFLGLLSGWMLIPAGYWFYRSYQHLPPLLLNIVIFGLLYTLAAILLHFSNDAGLLMLACIICGAFSFKETNSAAVVVATRESPLVRWLSISAGLIIIAFILVAFSQFEPEKAPAEFDLKGSKGYFGDNQAAFVLGGTVYQLAGEHDPHLRDLVQNGDQVGVFLATAPDYLLIDTLPDDPALNLLGYTSSAGVWQRQATVYQWRVPHQTDLVFGTDLDLVSVTQDRQTAQAGDILRLRLDWELAKAPTQPLLFQLSLLDFQQAGFGGVQQFFPAEKWQSLAASTYHAVPVNVDAPPGLYQVQLAIDYNGGIVDRQNVATLKIPVASDITFTEPALAHFPTFADLMQVELDQQGDQVTVRLIWQANRPLEADYTVFVHLTAPDDVTPVSQGDAPPMNGRYPTSIWAAGEVIEDVHLLNLAEVPPGNYVIRVGLYEPTRGRLLTADGDAVIIGEITR